MKTPGYRKLKKILLATLATSAIFFPRIELASAAETVQPENSSNNRVTVNENGYEIERTENGLPSVTSADTDGEYDMVYGGGGERNSGEASDNNVTINGGKFNGIFGGMSTYGSVFGNVIIVNGGTISGGVAGGVLFFPYNSTGILGNVYGNRVVIRGGTIGFVSGGEIAYANPSSEGTPDFTQYSSGSVYDNTTEVHGGKITDGISGGSALTGSAFGNKIIITGGTISGSIIGGEVRYQTANSKVTGNQIIILNSPDLSGATLIGGLLRSSDSSGSSYSSDGNILSIQTSGLTAQNIYGFGGINFVVPGYAINSSTPILTLTSGTTTLGLDTIGIQFYGDANLNTGDTVNLIYNANRIDTGDTTSRDITVTRGVTGIYGLNLANNGTGLTGTVTRRLGDTVNVPSIPVPNIAPVVSINPVLAPNDITFGIEVDDNGHFLTPEESHAQAVENVREQHGYEVFMNTGFGHMKTKTGGGTYIKSDNTTIDLGMARTLMNDNSRTYIAPIVEHNHGTYEGHLRDGIDGNGNTKYWAGGVIARNMQDNGFYYEGSIRAGRSENNFASDNFIVNNAPQRVSYDMEAPLFAGHVHIGSFRRLNADNILNVYGIYARTQQNGLNSDLSSGEHVHFNSVHSNRLRLGYRMTTRTSRISRIYTGLAYQYESNSSSTASGDNWSNTSAGAKGSSLMLELGWQIKPRKDIPWMVDVYSTGWLGHQQGGTIMAKVKKSF